MRIIMLLILFLFAFNFLFAQDEKKKALKFKAFQTAVSKGKIVPAELKWDNTDILVVINFGKRKITTYSFTENTIDFFSDDSSYKDENGNAWLVNSGIDDYGERCKIKFVYYMGQKNASTHAATLFISRSDHTITYRLKAID